MFQYANDTLNDSEINGVAINGEDMILLAATATLALTATAVQAAAQLTGPALQIALSADAVPGYARLTGPALTLSIVVNAPALNLEPSDTVYASALKSAEAVAARSFSELLASWSAVQPVADAKPTVDPRAYAIED